jgi:spore coat protein U-like protein
VPIHLTQTFAKIGAAAGRSYRPLALGIAACIYASGNVSTYATTSAANLAVQITITASCTINAATLDFGPNNPGTTLIAANIDAISTVSVTCTSGSPYSIGMDNGANASGTQRRMKTGANFLNYNLYVDAGRTNAWTTASTNIACTTANSCALGTGNGSAQSVSIYGRVPSIGTAPPPGTYTDTVLMTITY